MGNAQNTGEKKETKSLTSIIDFIATDYILTQNFTDMYNLTDERYCDKLLILTSKIISKYLSNIEIDEIVTKRIGDELTDDVQKNKILFLRKKAIKEFEKIDPELKQKMCNGISKFYIKIAQLFASITSMVNPTYTYKSRHGEDITFDTFDKAKLEKHNVSLTAKPVVKFISFCGRRIDCLTNGLDISTINNRGDRFTISPTFCKVNKTKKGSIISLDKEPGIGELEHLFYDTYDWSTKRFSKMSDTAQKEYDEAVQRFWKIWTTEEDRKGLAKPKKFSDITMKHFHHTQGCLGTHEEGKRGFQTSLYRRDYTGSREEDSLFGDYVDNIKEIMESAEKHEKELLDILDEVFKNDLNPLSGKKEITLTDELDMKKLKEIISRLRIKQVDMYIECEQKFFKGFKVFEKIVANRMLSTTNLRQENLSKESSAITDKMKKMMSSEKTVTDTDVAELNKKLGISNVVEEEDDDDGLTDDIAGDHLKGMLKKILKKNPDIVDSSDMDFFGKYRPALQNEYKRKHIERLLRDVHDIDKDKYRIHKKDTDKVLDELADIILKKESKIKHNLDKFKSSVQTIRDQSKEDDFRKRIRELQKKEFDRKYRSDIGSDTDSESDSDSDSDSEMLKDILTKEKESERLRKEDFQDKLKKYRTYKTTDEKYKEYIKEKEAQDAYEKRKADEEYKRRKAEEEYKQRRAEEEYRKRKEQEEYERYRMRERLI
jgi:hypothetical protein